MIVVLIVSAALAQRPESAAPSAEVAAQEARHLTNVRQVTSGFARAGEGYFSPDGRTIVFQATPNGPPAIFRKPRPNEDAYQIFLGPLEEDAEPRMVSTGKGRCTCAYFSPDGQSVIFGSSHLDPDVDKPADPRGPAYSRSERYRWDFPEHMDIFRAGLDGSGLTRLTDTPGYNAEGTAERQLTNNEFVNWGPYWHPDGRHIIYATSRHGHQNYELYLMDVDSGAEERITYQEGFDGLPVFSPDGRRLMWTSSGRTPDKKSQLFIADFTLLPAKPAEAR